ncbi:hypothetical protein [Asticcacaulis sp.]|uniref:hypothetical protein n=1 Tax=Asticcacaulis sp. TaxID=1872648 RepID=UPI00260E16BD|nr:hypothetical protein [Asticcacaulis sp.]
MANPIMDLLRAGLNDVLAAMADGRTATAHEAFASIKPVLEGRAICAALEHLLQGQASVERVADGLYATGGDGQYQDLRRAHQFVVGALSDQRALLLVRFDDICGSPRHEGGLYGIGVITLSSVSVDFETLVHELVHGVASSGHRLLDEGLAEWLSILATSVDAADARRRLNVRAADGPPAAVLAARRWTDQPCFEGLAARPAAAHAVAAITVAQFVDKQGMSAFLNLMSTVRAGRIEDIRGWLDLDPAPTVTTEMSADAQESQSLRRQFRMGDDIGASQKLPCYREAYLRNPDNDTLEVNYLLSLLLAANDPDAEALRAELDQALEQFLTVRGDTPLAYALCVSREGLKIRYAPNFIALNDSFKRGRLIVEAALDAYPDDLDVVVSAAKFEQYTPREYGGSPARVRAYLQRAVALGDDALLTPYLRSAIARLDQGGEPA